MPYTDFHYTPTGTGVISGKEVLEQTEDAINDLGGQISGDVQTAIDTANNALNVANTASADAQNAVNTANTAYTTATNAQNTANTAQNTASNALTAAQNAQNDVNALGNRVTTAENNISQNTSDISGLTTRMGSAEGNITSLQNDVITAQGTATSAQNTATMARQQAYVLRYSGTAITDNSTIAYSTLDNTDNIKVSDKIIDSDGKIFSVVSIDSANETVTVGSALIDLALDANVMHLSGNETASGQKTFSGGMALNSWLNFTNSLVTKGTIPQSTLSPYRIYFGSGVNYGNSLFNIDTSVSNTGVQTLTLRSAENVVSGDDTRLYITYDPSLTQPRCIKFKGDCAPNANNTYECGTSTDKWKTFNGINPGALSLPDLSNGIDISGYINTGDSDNSYTPLADGYISVRINSTNGCALYALQGNVCTSSYGNIADVDLGGFFCSFFIPVVKNVACRIVCRRAQTIVSAKFYPCQGNV
ncbi:MAG: hypothetical protein II244_04655 [Clostridia bacterium]|nr:hypothetical protein [Clostridia bacterium]